MNLVLKFTLPFLFCLTSFSGAYANDDQPAFFSGLLTFKNQTLNVAVTIQKKPVVGKETTILLQAQNPETLAPVDIADTVEVDLWMPDMGHGSAPTTVERALDEKGEPLPGVFGVRDVYFTMGGVWEINVNLIDAEGQIETQTFSVKISGGHHH